VEAAACARPATGYTYARREPEKSALYKTLQEHLLTFEQEWTDKSDGRTLPSFVTDELHDCPVGSGTGAVVCRTPLGCSRRGVRKLIAEVHAASR
jgi:hypothetical protein